MRRDAKTEYIWETERAAQRLGIPSHGPAADAAIVDFCRQQVSNWAAAHGLPLTMGEFLEMVASCLDIEFVEIHSDEDLAALIRRIPPDIEPTLACVGTELDDDTDAVTIRRLAPEAWEQRYLAVINCRGWHHSRRFFTKWHELAHRLVDGEQLQFAFRRTPVDRKESDEILIDKVAGALAFYPDIVGPSAEKCLRASGLTFESVDALRHSVAQEASRQATALALITHVDRPAWYFRCAETLKPAETRVTVHSDVRQRRVPKLRVTEVSPNDRARRSSIRIHQWMRVPESSLVSLARTSGVDKTGSERLDQWETSAGGPIGSGRLSIDSWVVRDEVFVLASIADESLSTT